MIKKRIWFNFDKEKRHAGKIVEMHGWYLFSFIPLYIIEYRTLN